MAERNIDNILVANRGVPAVRIMHTCRDRKIRSTAVYSTPDRLAHHVTMADAAVHIGEAPPVESYLNMDRIIDAALRSKADAVHAGWGFLAENAAFARRVIDAGLTWIGPPPDVIGRLGDKIEAKQIARAANVPVIPGIDHVTEAEQVRRWMREENVAFPVMLKAAGGGGGRGMVKVEHDAHLHMAIGQARSEAKKFFGSETVLAEKYVERGRHIEVQIIADQHGNVVHLYERECTIQRRHQKIVEEAPSPTLDTELREEICADRRAPDARDRLRLGRDRGVPLRLRDPAVLLPRGQHPAAGRARHHRADHRRRHRQPDAGCRRGQAAALPPGGDPAQPLGARGAAQRRGPAQLQPLLRQHRAPDRPPGAERPRRLRRLRGGRRAAVLRLAADARDLRRQGPRGRHQRHGPLPRAQPARRGRQDAAAAAALDHPPPGVRRRRVLDALHRGAPRRTGRDLPRHAAPRTRSSRSSRYVAEITALGPRGWM